MRVRLTALLVVLAAAVPAGSAWAQEVPPPTPTPEVIPTPTPTVTPTPTPTPEEIEEAEEKAKLRKRKIVRRVYADFRRDAKIDNCEHSRTALKRTLESVTDEFDADFPEFREAIKAAIKDHDKERCEAEAEPTPTPAPTTPPPASTPAPTTPAPVVPPPSNDDGGLPDFDGGGGGGGGGGNNTPPPSTTPPTEGDVTPVQPEATPPPAVTPAAPVQPQLAVTRPGSDPNLLVPGLLLLAALIGLGALGASALAARRSDRFPGWGHAWREAAYRTSGAWGDFGDWLRLGR